MKPQVTGGGGSLSVFWNETLRSRKCTSGCGTSTVEVMDLVALRNKLHDRLHTEGFETTAAPLGWRCSHCHEHLSITDLPADPARYPRILEHLTVSSYRHRQTCPPGDPQ